MGRPFSVIIFIAAAALAFSCSSGSDAEKIADSMDDALTDSLAFDDAQTAEGPPPPESGSADAPQISQAPAASEMRLGEQFVVSIAPAEAQNGETMSLILYVGKSKKHFVIPKTVTNGKLALTGVLKPARLNLRGYSVEIIIALKDADGLVGTYKKLSFKVADLDPLDASEDLLKDALNITVNWISSGRPAGSGDSSVPQITALAYAPTIVSLGRDDSIGISASADNKTNVAAILMSAPAAEGYLRITSFEKIPQNGSDGFDYYVSFALNKTSLLNRHLVVLLALEGNDGKNGLWYPWEFDVREGILDGDFDIFDFETDVNFR